MFEHLPIITDDSVNVMVAQGLDWFIDSMQQCLLGTETPEEAIDCACVELYRVNNASLVKVIKAAAYAVVGALKGEVEPGKAWQAGMLAVPGLLCALRLIERALEAKELEERLNS